MTYKNILITGASSGIGSALASFYAAPGISLTLWGRDANRLEEIAERCRAKGALVETESLDLTDIAAMATRLEALDERLPLDLVFFNAGLGGSLPRDRIGQSAPSSLAMASVNFTAPAVAANVMAERMGRRGAGHIVLVGSVAAVFPLPMAPLYSGSKAGLAMFADALSLRLKRYGVAVSLVSPGFVDTPMSQSLSEPRPFLISAEKAAATIARKVKLRARRIVLPWQFAVILALSRLLPGFMVRAVLARL